MKGHAGLVVVVTCEHGGNAIPRRWAPLFRDRGALLATHRGWDIGAAKVAERIASAFRAPLLVATTSRLLVDLNRSPHHPRFFSDVVRALPPEERERIVREHYQPHRSAVEGAIREALRRGKSVLHLGVHSFTPVLDGVRRTADLGLLYDPARPMERGICADWRAAVMRAEPSYVVRKNYPYRGIGDGLTTSLRRMHAPSRYAGVEVEMNQALLGARKSLEHLSAVLVESLGTLL
jgi:predicted N-formylglutamate amidohydrolase